MNLRGTAFTLVDMSILTSKNRDLNELSFYPPNSYKLQQKKMQKNSKATLIQ